MTHSEGFDERAPWDITQSAQREAALAAARRALRTPAYRREWAAAGVSEGDLTLARWDALPILSKEVLVEAARRAPPFGDRLGVERQRLAHVFAAPGPFYMPFTEGDLEHIAGSFAKAITSCGFEPGDLVDQTTMYNWVIAATALDRALRKAGCGVVPGGVGQTEHHIEVIEQLGVIGIVAFPTFLEQLLAQAASAGKQLALRKAAVMGELHDPRSKQRMRETYGITVREFYGTADVGAVAWECSAGQGMHLRDDLLVEFVAPGHDHPVEPRAGEPAEIVVTDFEREAMPIIRLRTGDLIDALAYDACACGRTSPRFARIVGRSSEITKVKGMFVVPRQVVDVMQRHGIERAFRLVVDRLEGGRDELTLEVAGEPLRDDAGFHAHVESALRMHCTLKYVSTLPAGGPRLVDRRVTA